MGRIGQRAGDGDGVMVQPDIVVHGAPVLVPLVVLDGRIAGQAECAAVEDVHAAADSRGVPADLAAGQYERAAGFIIVAAGQMHAAAGRGMIAGDAAAFQGERTSGQHIHAAAGGSIAASDDAGPCAATVPYGQIAGDEDGVAIRRLRLQVAVQAMAVQVEDDIGIRAHKQVFVAFVSGDVAVQRDHRRGVADLAGAVELLLKLAPRGDERRRHGDVARGHGELILAVFVRGDRMVRAVVIAHFAGLIARGRGGGQRDLRPRGGAVGVRGGFASVHGIARRHAAVLAGADDDVRRLEGDAREIGNLVRDVAGIEAAVATAQVLSVGNGEGGVAVVQLIAAGLYGVAGVFPAEGDRAGSIRHGKDARVGAACGDLSAIEVEVSIGINTTAIVIFSFCLGIDRSAVDGDVATACAQSARVIAGRACCNPAAVDGDAAREYGVAVIAAGVDVQRAAARRLAVEGQRGFVIAVITQTALITEVERAGAAADVHLAVVGEYDVITARAHHNGIAIADRPVGHVPPRREAGLPALEEGEAVAGHRLAVRAHIADLPLGVEGLFAGGALVDSGRLRCKRRVAVPAEEGQVVAGFGGGGQRDGVRDGVGRCILVFDVVGAVRGVDVGDGVGHRAERRRDGDGYGGHGEGPLVRVVARALGEFGRFRLFALGIAHSQAVRRQRVARRRSDGEGDGLVLAGNIRIRCDRAVLNAAGYGNRIGRAGSDNQIQRCFFLNIVIRKRMAVFKEPAVEI